MNGGTLLRFLLILAWVATPPLVFVVLIGTAGWLSDHTHRFGPYDVRYLLLIHGTWVGELGLVEPIAGTVEYTGQGEEGTAPAYAGAAFKTGVPPEKVIDTYSARCHSVGLAVQRLPSKGQEPAVACERENLTAAISIEARRSRDLTEVVLAGWEFE